MFNVLRSSSFLCRGTRLFAACAVVFALLGAFSSRPRADCTLGCAVLNYYNHNTAGTVDGHWYVSIARADQYSSVGNTVGTAATPMNNVNIWTLYESTVVCTQIDQYGSDSGGYTNSNKTTGTINTICQGNIL